MYSVKLRAVLDVCTVMVIVGLLGLFMNIEQGFLYIK